MGFVTWLRNFFSEGVTTVTLTDKINSGENIIPLVYEDFTIMSAINLISGSISKCEFRTFEKDKEMKGEEYYAWNIEPNKNQNSSTFLQELISKLLYYNECLVIPTNSQMIIADSFNQTEYALIENTFDQVTRGDFTFNKTFKMSEVLYFKMNNKDIKAQLTNLYMGYSDLISKSINKYSKAGGRKGILKINSQAYGQKDFQEKFNKLMNERFKSYFDAENAVLPLFDGYDYTEPSGEQGKKAANEIGDIKTLMDEACKRTGQAFKIPVVLLTGDVADVEKVTDNLLTFCIDPLCDTIKTEINRKRYGKTAYLKGDYMTIDTTCIRHIDIFNIANSVDKLRAGGMYNIDELRRKVGDTQLNTPWSKKYVITKNYQDIESMNTLEGGE